MGVTTRTARDKTGTLPFSRAADINVQKPALISAARSNPTTVRLCRRRSRPDMNRVVGSDATDQCKAECRQKEQSRKQPAHRVVRKRRILNSIGSIAGLR